MVIEGLYLNYSKSALGHKCAMWHAYLNASPISESKFTSPYLPLFKPVELYFFQERRNVHYFFDQESGNWIRLPISWELNSELIQKLLDPIQVQLFYRTFVSRQALFSVISVFGYILLPCSLIFTICG